MSQRGFVSADRTREHIHALHDAGVTYEQIARLAGLGRGYVLSRILYGSPAEHRPPSRFVKSSTEAAILAVEADDALAPDVDEAVVWRITNGDRTLKPTRAERLAVIQVLHAQGLTDGQIARRTGWPLRDVFRNRRGALDLPSNYRRPVSGRPASSPSRQPTPESPADAILRPTRGIPASPNHRESA